MAVKMLGAEWRALLEDDKDWPNGAYYDDAEVTVNGVEELDPHKAFDDGKIPDDARVVVSGGTMCLPRNSGLTIEELDFETFIRRWLKKRAHDYFVIEVPKTRSIWFSQHIKELQLKVVK